VKADIPGWRLAVWRTHDDEDENWLIIV